MDAQQLDEILRRWEATTPEPWQSFVEGRDHLAGSSFIMTGGPDRGPVIELHGATPADQDFIASAHQDIPLLLQEIRRLQQMTRSG